VQQSNTHQFKHQLVTLILYLLYKTASLSVIYYGHLQGVTSLDDVKCFTLEDGANNFLRNVDN